MKWILLHKLALLHIASISLDILSTARVQSKDRYLPPRGALYLSADGLMHQSPGRVRDITLGYPSTWQIALEVPAGDIITLALHHKFPNSSRKALEVETAVHFAGAFQNIRLLGEMKSLPRPVCLIGNPGCVQVPVLAQITHPGPTSRK